MGNNQSEREYEEIRLKQTISLAEEQLKQAKEAAEKKEITNYRKPKKKFVKTQHIVLQIYTLLTDLRHFVELSQYMNLLQIKL